MRTPCSLRKYMWLCRSDIRGGQKQAQEAMRAQERELRMSQHMARPGVVVKAANKPKRTKKVEEEQSAEVVVKLQPSTGLRPRTEVAEAAKCLLIGSSSSSGALPVCCRTATT
jgi:hypothetical protein